jgi:hypothetical protein
MIERGPQNVQSRGGSATVRTPLSLSLAALLTVGVATASAPGTAEESCHRELER